MPCSPGSYTRVVLTLTQEQARHLADLLVGAQASAPLADKICNATVGAVSGPTTVERMGNLLAIVRAQAKAQGVEL